MTNIVAGWTEKLRYQLKKKTTAEAINLSGCTVALLARTKDGASVTLAGSGAATIDDAAQGKVSYTPNGTEFTAADSPYSLTFRVTDPANGIYFVPEKEPEILRVRSA